MKRLTYLIAAIALLTSCDTNECVSCRYHTGEVQEVCASQLSSPDMQLNIFEQTMTNSGWVCSRHSE